MGRRKLLWIAMVLLSWACVGQTARAQFDEGMIPPEDPMIRYTSVSFIDSAFAVSTYRIRFDSMYRNNRPTRAEFIWAQTGAPAPGGSGPPIPETNLDYQELMNYLELAFFENRFSVFLNTPVRFTNPTLNNNNAGFGDLDAGFKWSFLQSMQWISSFQLRTYVPTGESNLGLGTGHVSIEPAFLFNFMPADYLTFESEFRYWIPVGGSSTYAGDVIRYGLGASLGSRSPSAWWVTPVVETVGWTALSGAKQGVDPPAPITITPARGDTIINLYGGIRAGLADRLDFYGGYGQSLTGETWHRNMFRFEFRFLF